MAQMIDATQNLRYRLTDIPDGTVYLPSGVMHVSDTIDLGSPIGLRIVGNGMGFQQLPFRPDGQVKIANPFHCTVINWIGPPDKPVFRIAGRGCVFDGITIWGQSTASAGWQVDNLKGIGSGKHHWTNCFVSHCGSGIRHGETFEQHNTDMFRMTNVAFHSCDSAIRIENTQCVGGVITGMQANQCGTVLDVEAGGSILINGLSVSDSGTVLRMNRQGTNNSDIQINGLNIDGRMPDGWRLFRNDRVGRFEPHISISGKISNQSRNLATVLSNDPASLDCSRLHGWDTEPFSPVG